jgi:hypothetical protein
MANRKLVRMKLLQRKCVRALQLHADLAEASCEMLLHFDRGKLSGKSRLKLSLLQRQEDAAISNYLRARKDLVNALTREPPPVDRGVCRVVSATT